MWTDAEFMVAVYGAKSTKYLSYILEELGLSRYEPENLFCDSTESIIIENSNKPTERSK